MKLVEEEEGRQFLGGWKKLSSNSSSCEVVEFIWILDSNQLGTDAFMKLFFSLTWHLFSVVS